MMLSQEYLAWKEATKQEGRLEGRQEGRQEGRLEGKREERRSMIENLLQVRFGVLDESIGSEAPPEVVRVVNGLLELSPAESSRLLLQADLEELIARFNS